MNIPNIEPYIKKHGDGTYTIFSGLPEFGYELLATLPLAWLLHREGKLRRTISGYDTRALYWFSPDHDELDEPRSYENVEKLTRSGFPNIEIHRGELNWELFSPPPLKDYFSQTAIKFTKPTVVITNRINSEWNSAPINYLSAKTLNLLFAQLRDSHQIVYLETSHFSSKYEDHAEFHRDAANLENIDFTGVIKFSTLLQEHPSLSINELQCRLYAGCDKFISSNGGLGILASYFGGENIIFTKQCHEIDPDVNSFHGWYPKLSRATITVARSEEDLLDRVKQKWVENLPLFNILIRTSGRPNYFHDCIKSVLDQSYKNYNIIVGCDDPSSMHYVQKFPCVRIPLEKHVGIKPEKPNSDDYGVWFPFNQYFSEMQKYAKQGYIIHLDDDDQFTTPSALSDLAEVILKDNPELIFWRVQFPNRLVPGDKNWELRRPVLKDIDSIGFCHSINLMPKWEPWKRGDYRVAKQLYERTTNTVWIDKVFTGLQRTVEDGFGMRDDKEMIYIPKSPPVTVVIPAFNAEQTLEECIDSIINQHVTFPVNILVGIDCCPKTLVRSRFLARKYGSSVSFFRAHKNSGPYIIKNSLLAKISRRDSIILCFDSDDLMPSGFLQNYYDFYTSAPITEHGRGILKTSFVDWFEETNDLSMKRIVDRVLRDGCSTRMAQLYILKNRFQLHRRYKKKANEFRPTLIPSVGIIMFDYVSAEKLGFYSEFRVAQDSDLIARANALGVPILYYEGNPWFIRRVSPDSLEFSSETGMGSRFRDDIKRENRRRISSGLLIAENRKAKLTPVL